MGVVTELPRAERGSRSPATKVCAGYLLAQAVLGVVLWVVLTASETVWSWFELVPSVPEVTDAFFFGDLGVIVVASAFGAWGVWSRTRWAVPVVAFTAGAVVYPTVYLIGWTSLTGIGSVPLWVMVTTSTLTCWVAWMTWRADLERPEA